MLNSSDDSCLRYPALRTAWLILVALGPQLRARFDIVSFDPRGVGDSAPITCLNDSQLDDYFALDPTPNAPGEVAR